MHHICGLGLRYYRIYTAYGYDQDDVQILSSSPAESEDELAKRSLIRTKTALTIASTVQFFRNKKTGSQFHGWRMGILVGCCINYTIQVLSAPTRAEVDKAHRKGQYFDIGVLSVHNLKRISWKRIFLCAIMLLSSVPLHLFYNSAAIYIATSNEFKIFLVDAGSSQVESLRANSSFKHFPAQTWRPAYSSQLVKYSDLYLAIDQWASDINITDKNGMPWEKGPTPVTLPLEIDLGSTVFNVTGWMNMTEIGIKNDTRTPFPRFARISQGYGVTSRSVDRLQLSLSFLVVVIVCNAIKLAVMLWVLCVEKSDFLVTIGDGAASFLEHRDFTTEKFCVFNKDAITAEVSHRNLRRRDRESMLNPGYRVVCCRDTTWSGVLRHL
ncbi:hypothetical protein DM02DRAFT_519244 [Periconia macrospinosa]|uniref:DUF6536 domain-containing protein n=1 Tax=Periconia macrospinosa TaxID=97972 RepID=A0A2V1E4E9_9PLEO|nr:hypothetical protein DM02DRAFT_519244 [Periconia macrospinosa]